MAESYRSVLGQPPFDPRMMTALLLHGYASGVYASRRIAKAAVERADFMMIVAGDPPDFRTIAENRKRHLDALAGLFVQVLKLAEKAGLARLGHVALDGTKINQDQGERLQAHQAQGDELCADEAAGGRVGGRGRPLAEGRGGGRWGRGQALWRHARR
jgi:transposase